MSVDQIRSSSGKFQRKIRWRNAREYVAALAVVIFFGFRFTRVDDLLLRTGFGVIIAGVLYVVWQLYSKGSSKPLPQDAGLSNCVEFHRRELERQRNLLNGIWRWYLGPMIPGLAIVLVAAGRLNPGILKQTWFVIYLVLLPVFFLGVAKLNIRAARKLQRRIDELDELRRES